MDIHAAIDEYLGAKQNSITQSTYEWYERYLVFFDRWCQTNHLTDLSQITPTLVQQFVAEAGPQASRHTWHGRAQIVKGFLSWCSKDDDLGVREKMVRRIEMPKLQQSDNEIFTDAEILRLFRACDRMKQPHRNRAIVHMLLDTGIRAAELAYDGSRPEEQTGLLLENLVLGRGDSYITVIGKGRKSRTIGLGQETTQAVRRYLNRERGRSESPYAFLSREGGPLSIRMLQQFLDELGELARVPDCHPHRFRYTFAVSQLLAGTSDLVLMKLLGHTTLESTKIYVRGMSQLQARKAAKSVVDRIKRQPTR